MRREICHDKSLWLTSAEVFTRDRDYYEGLAIKYSCRIHDKGLTEEENDRRNTFDTENFTIAKTLSCFVSKGHIRGYIGAFDCSLLLKNRQLSWVIIA